MDDGAINAQIDGLWNQLEGALGLAPRLRIGIDVVGVEILTRQMNSTIGTQFGEAVFTEQELEDCRGRGERFATRWALKEAVSKAIGTGFREGLRPVDVEILTSPSGAVTVQPASGARWPNGAERWSWALSASHEAGIAAAIAVAVLNDSGKEKS